MTAPELRLASVVPFDLTDAPAKEVGGAIEKEARAISVLTEEGGYEVRRCLVPPGKAIPTRSKATRQKKRVEDNCKHHFVEGHVDDAQFFKDLHAATRKGSRVHDVLPALLTDEAVRRAPSFDRLIGEAREEALALRRDLKATQLRLEICEADRDNVIRECRDLNSRLEHAGRDQQKEFRERYPFPTVGGRIHETDGILCMILRALVPLALPGFSWRDPDQ